MRVLTVNVGSSSVKLRVIDRGELVAERSGAPGEGALEELAADPGLDAVAHRVVHGGPELTSSVRVDQDVLATLRRVCELAPLHSALAIDAIEDGLRARADLPAVACFDTSFHAGLPAEARTYALPQGWAERWGLRRYGFHGLSHAYAARRAAELLERPLAGLCLVTCHLGAGASLAAVRDGRSVDTTMGFTPLEGLVMATRSGSVDPGLVLWLVREAGMDPAALEHALDNESGLLGLSGRSGDMRDLLEAEAEGHEPAALALGVYVHRLRGAIASMAAALGRLDALVFTGGVGEHAAHIRARACAGLALLGVPPVGAAEVPAGEDAELPAGSSAVRVLVVHSREDLEMAAEAERVLGYT